MFEGGHTLSQTNPKIDAFISKAKQWKEEYTYLRSIMLETELVEELKWYQPAYTIQNSIVLILGGFKEFIAISFFKGVLLKDEQHLLVKAGDNTHVPRLIKFKSIQEMIDLKPIIKAYVEEAIAIEKAGLKAEPAQKAELEYPDELIKLFNENPDFMDAFEKLTPGRRRAYNLFFTGAKQSATRLSRIEKYVDRIMDGKGIND
jgi:uncharacterized protein YdeI (YjbR/CyaY-like superfamily)